MYLNVVYIITFAAWISSGSASFTTQEPVYVQSNHDLGPCDEENYGRRELIKDSDGNETLLICSHDNGVYSWKEDAMETEIDDTDHVMEDVMLKREAATEFFQRDRRGSLDHECYIECCSWEEVCENYGNDRREALKYWNKFRTWKKKNKNKCKTRTWTW
ncbi:---NA--- [Paramuricea clavata]|uniref:---NA n=1 Tax=Paramuricea clavata TaxID=317549 RepID=A0A6S7H7Q6_PARCT|nr:---NA--- [Paramuricea clavata]